MTVRSFRLAALGVIGLTCASLGSVIGGSTPLRAQASSALPQSWATTIRVGAGSSSHSCCSAEPLGGATIADLFGDGRKQVVVGFQDGSVSVLDGLTGAELPG